MKKDFTVVGQPYPIHDAFLKVTGQKTYVGDMKLPNMLYGKVLFSTVAHGKIKRIDTSKAEALPGVRAVATYKNTPSTRFNSAVRFIEHELPLTERIFDDRVRFAGDKVAAVAADSLAIAEKAIRLIEVEYEELPVILDVEEAIKEDAYPIHERGNVVGKAFVDAGNVEEGFAQSDYIFEDRFTTQPIHHAAMEPHVAIADWGFDDKLTLYTPCQNSFGFRVILSQIFNLPYSKIRLKAPAIGGGFGGKLEVTVEPIAGAMRGYGSPQAYFGMQRQLQKIANFLHMDMKDLQMLNMVDPDSLDSCFHKPHGNPRPKDCLTKALHHFDYEEALKEQECTHEDTYRIGVGLALGVHGNNCFGAHRDVSSLMIKMNEDGSCILYTGSHDMGNDNVGVQMQIISEELGISLSKIDAVEADTDACLWHLGDYSSRGTFVVGGAALEVAEKMRKELQIEAAKLLQTEPENIELKQDRAYRIDQPEISASLRDVMIYCQSVSMRELCCYVTHPAPRGANSYGLHIAKVGVDTQTGKVDLLEYSAAHDVGHVINPMALEGQLAGGIQMGLGYGLCENMEFAPNGRPLTTNLKKYHILRAKEMPKLHLDFVAEGEGEPGGPYGAKSLGESPVVPAAPAVVNAICNALDVEIDNLPADPATILKAFNEKK